MTADTPSLLEQAPCPARWRGRMLGAQRVASHDQRLGWPWGLDVVARERPAAFVLPAGLTFDNL